jgi:hypothetical protein
MKVFVIARCVSINPPTLSYLGYFNGRAVKSVIVQNRVLSLRSAYKILGKALKIEGTILYLEVLESEELSWAKMESYEWR